ncbi:DUF1641 domain-containing protein [Alkalicoccus urumqiensis]|uniref:DUF1641 domain-containing protein n=1 Tax=Alkalicoccus urumqiensis TaxID=1548213 RepID=A0A2P6MH76_ALKUR|nr:DUF1641 domain-containing protein [Alkalicoccus urumqiensis]PRO65623.1 hypothetical protein C6I21_08860 [Alkalicoccus urumqiensis]
MAKPIRDIEPIPISKEQERENAINEILDKLADNQEAVHSTLDLIASLQKSGILHILTGLFSEGDKVLDVIVQEAAKEENTNAIRNLLLLGGTLGTINVKELEPLLLKINHGVARVAEDPDPDEKTGYVDLVKKLKDPQINRSLTVLFRFLEGMGEKTEQEERN